MFQVRVLGAQLVRHLLVHASFEQFLWEQSVWWRTYCVQRVVSMKRKGRYNDHTYRKRNAALRAHVDRTGEPCWLCGQPIDLALPYTHPMSFTADHVEAIANGGKLLSELRPAHRRCNSSRGKKRVDELIPRPKTSRIW